METTRRYHSRRKLLTIGFSVFALAASAWLARSDSLFPVKQSGQSGRGSSSATAANLYTDTRAHSVGDPLTVLISENTSAQSSANTKTAKDNSASLNPGTGLFHRLFQNLGFTASTSHAGSGSGQTTRTGSLVTTLSVLVKEVLPNGTLRIEGSRMVGINKETQRVTFSGIVRPEDVGIDNSISSNLVADVEVRYDGKGVVNENQKSGLLSRIFHFLF